MNIYSRIFQLLSEIQDPNDPGPHPAPFSGMSRKQLRGRTQEIIDADPYKAPEQKTPKPKRRRPRGFVWKDAGTEGK